MVLLAGWWSFLSAYLLYCAIDNALFFARPPKIDSKRRNWPMISVLIPARNEAARIEPCLKSLLAQDHPNFEILVLDDRSTDDTFNLIQKYASKNSEKIGRSLKILRGKKLPKGWLGKPWACYQLSLKAKGKWLFFVDADTWHLPETLKRTTQMAEIQKADVLSLLTRQVTKTWMEALVIPIMIFHLLSFFPARWVLRPQSRFNRFAGVSGQFIFVRKMAYQAIGGHQAVKNEIVEDLNFGKLLAKAGFRVVIGNGTDFSFCRMYTNTLEVWNGFSKNFFPAVGYSIPALIAAVLILWLNGLLPFIFLIIGIRTILFWPAFALCLVLCIVRLLEAVQYGMNRTSVFFHPLGCFLFSLIAMNSFRWFGIKGYGLWKGRKILKPIN